MPVTRDAASSSSGFPSHKQETMARPNFPKHLWHGSRANHCYTSQLANGTIARRLQSLWPYMRNVCSSCVHSRAHQRTNGLSRGKHCSELPRRFKRARTHTHSTHSRAKLKPWASTLPTETASLQWLPACNSEPTLGVKRCNESLKGCHSACTDNWRRTVA